MVKSTAISPEHPRTLPTDVWPDQIKRFSVKQYQTMIDAGVFGDDAEIELLEGWVVEKMSKDRLHVILVELVRAVLQRLILGNYHFASEAPILTDDSVPEPDVSVIQGELLDYVSAHPEADRVELAIEVAYSSLSRDQNWKQQIYAASNIPTYWIINTTSWQIEVYTQPGNTEPNPSYLQKRTYRNGDTFPLQLGDNIIGTIAVDDILPFRLKP